MIYKKTEDEPVYCPYSYSKRAFANYTDHAKIVVVSKKWCNAQSYGSDVDCIIDQHLAEKSRQKTVRSYFPIRDY